MFYRRVQEVPRSSRLQWKMRHAYADLRGPARSSQTSTEKGSRRMAMKHPTEAPRKRTRRTERLVNAGSCNAHWSACSKGWTKQGRHANAFRKTVFRKIKERSGRKNLCWMENAKLKCDANSKGRTHLLRRGGLKTAGGKRYSNAELPRHRNLDLPTKLNSAHCAARNARCRLERAKVPSARHRQNSVEIFDVLGR